MSPYLDSFTNLPQEITIDILLRLPVGNIAMCKSVCKSWRDLIGCSEFTHLSKSTSLSSGLALIQDVESSNPYKICNDVGVDGCTTISNFVLPAHKYTELCSADGLLFLFDVCTIYGNIFLICNPITRECIRLSAPPMYEPRKATFGFGASKVTGEDYKVVIICQKNENDPPEGMVYSLRTGLWGSIKAAIHTHDPVVRAAALLNGNLHWLYDEINLDHDPKLLISCFDLETEQFSSFHLPPRDHGYWSPSGGHGTTTYYLSALEGRLCFCENVDHEKIVIWCMNRYGDENSWTEEFIINVPSFDNQPNCRKFLPVKVFRDSGDILFEADCWDKLFIYSNETKSIKEYAAGSVQVREGYTASVVNYSPSFLSLKAMGFQNVASFQ